MQQAVPAALQLLAPAGWLAILTTTEEVPNIQAQINTASSPIVWQPTQPLLAGTNRILLLGERTELPLNP